MLEEIRKECEAIINELLENAKLEEEKLLIIGCSTSEVVGGKIGKDSNLEVAETIYNAIAPVLEKNKIELAAQCCEYLNRCLVLEKSVALKRGYEIVKAVPKMHAGGSFATIAYQKMKEPVLVEEIKADAGLDIGNTLIGMHLKKVAVPLRLSTAKLYKANIVCAYTRPKYIGGERTMYQ